MPYLNKKYKLLISVPAVLLYLLVGINLPVSAATCPPLSESGGAASTTFTVSTTGTYRIWARIYASTSGKQSLGFTIDNNCPATITSNDTPSNSFGWLGIGTNNNPVSIPLTRGVHSITVAGQGSAIGIDRMLLTTDRACIPTGYGNDCAASTAVSVQPTKSNSAKNDSATKKTSVLKLATYGTTAIIIAAIVACSFLYVASRPGSALSRLLRFSIKRNPSHQLTSSTPAVVVTSQAQQPRFVLSRKRAVLFISVFAVICGLATIVAMAAASNSIVINFSNATTTGNARIVSNANTVNGKIVEFGSTNAGSAVSTAGTPAVGLKTHGFSRTTNAQPSKSSPGTGSGASSGGGSSSGSGSSGSGSSSGSTISSCTNPSWNTSEATGTDGISDTWWVNNDAWSGTHGPQSIYVCNQSSWYAVSNQTDNGGQVETYPDTEYDVGGRSTPNTKSIAQLNTISSTFSESYPAAGSWDAAYDLWTNNWTNETMIWNQWAGTEDYWGSCAEPGSSQNDCVGSGGASTNSKAATIDGVAYHFLALGSNCSAATEANCEYIFFRDSQVASGSVNILAAWQWEVANGFAKSTDVPTQLEYGVEVCSTNGSETFPMTGLTFTVN